MRNMERFGRLFDLSGHVAVVTGAAQGNGAGIANALYDAGAKVIATDITFPDEKEEAAENDRFHCKAHGRGLYKEIKRTIMDVTAEESIAHVFQAVSDEHGGLDILCNNAGLIYKGGVAGLDIKRFQKVTEVNLHGTVNCTKLAVPYMRKAGWGRIVNISSSQAFLATETYSAYAASKAAVSHLTRIWGNELAGENIFVNALCPSFVKTPMMVNSIAQMAKELHTDTKGAERYFTDLIPMHRLLEMEEIGNWAVMLCGELGNAATGSNFSITCGQVTL